MSHIVLYQCILPWSPPSRARGVRCCVGYNCELRPHRPKEKIAEMKAGVTSGAVSHGMSRPRNCLDLESQSSQPRAQLACSTSRHSGSYPRSARGDSIADADAGAVEIGGGTAGMGTGVS